MARKAASKTQGRTPRQVNATGPVATPTTDVPRRGRKPKQREMQPSEPALVDLLLPGDAEPVLEGSAETDSAQLTAIPPMVHDEPAADTKHVNAAADDAVTATRDAAPAKTRQRRRPKPQLEIGLKADPITDAGTPMMDAPTKEMTSVVSAEQPSNTGTNGVFDDRAKTPPATLGRGRARKPEAAPQFPATQPEQRNDGSMANLPAADQAEAGTPVTVGSAVHWDPGTDTVTFDWPAIEQVAAAEGSNRGMAKLLLAARAEGANSRWPF